jgi:hypothetical protein
MSMPCAFKVFAFASIASVADGLMPMALFDSHIMMFSSVDNIFAELLTNV